MIQFLDMKSVENLVTSPLKGLLARSSHRFNSIGIEGAILTLSRLICLFLFVVFPCSTLFGAPLKSVSCVEQIDIPRRYVDFLHLPHNLNGYFDFNEAVEEAKSVDKPILVYVVGHACNNCREMENVVWSDSKVLPMLQNDFVICALYVDDMTKVEGGKRLGSINYQLAQERWGINAQPGYVLLSPDGEKVLAAPRGYDCDINAFVEFLSEGLSPKITPKSFGIVQNENEGSPVEWLISAEDNGDGTFDVTFDATIAEGFHGYPMTDFSAPYFEFDNVEIVGEVVEPLTAQERSDDFGGTLFIYYDKATYIFTVKANPSQKISGFIQAIICTNDTNQCTANFAEFFIFMPACAY